ncbi:MAG: DMT family transporter [Gemmatimonadales bacterium]
MSTERRTTPTLTAMALTAFAANSILCRLALRNGSIDAASFSAIRIAAGATSLLLLLQLRRPGHATRPRGSWAGAAALALYGVPFSFAFLSLSAGTGALLLFSAVQITMVLASMLRGVRPRPGQWAGLALAFGGLVYLFLPGITAPAPLGAVLMLVAGTAWGVYSLRGHGAQDALAETTGNFMRAVPVVWVVWLVAFASVHVQPTGIIWAVLSGAVASGIGYVIWYAALRHLSSVTAAAVQLAVPLLAGLGGILLLDERLTFRLAVAAVLVLGGIGMTIAGRATTS